MLQMATKNLPKNAPRFNCEICDYSTSKKSSFDSHLTTTKHVNAIHATKNAEKTCQNSPDVFTCDCGSEYKHHASLWRHRKTCTFQKEKQQVVASDVSNNAITKDDFLNFLKNDLKEILVEVLKHGVGSTTNSHNTTNKNKFNMNFFLNEQCKDAMNIMDFVNTMQLQLSDLERVGELGYVKGISHIVTNKLKDLEVTKRPIHCSDLKRETMYVKDENMWEKENEKKEKLAKMIKHVAHKNQKQIKDWQEENPEYKDSESVQSEKFLKIVGESMTGLTNDDDAECCTNKIIKNIAKEVMIEKEEE
jgi:hypothetical protein